MSKTHITQFGNIPECEICKSEEGDYWDVCGECSSTYHPECLDKYCQENNVKYDKVEPSDCFWDHEENEDGDEDCTCADFYTIKSCPHCTNKI